MIYFTGDVIFTSGINEEVVSLIKPNAYSRKHTCRYQIVLERKLLKVVPPQEMVSTW